MRALIFIGVLCYSFSVWGQSQPLNEEVQIAFWNVENLFDTKDDTLTNDDEYLPYSMRGWNYDRYQKKLNHIYKTIIAMGEWQPPTLIALAEVENKHVLEDLLTQTPLARVGYHIVHQNSEDRRGIDLAILYQPKKIALLDTTFINIRFPAAPNSRTRDVIYIKGKVLAAEDTIHLWANHWPSRYGGGKSSEGRRVYVSDVVKAHLENVIQNDENARCIVLGDFNDAPNDLSLQNLSSGKVKLTLTTQESFHGTHKYQGIWSHFDQIWLSPSVSNKVSEGTSAIEGIVFHPEWLLTKDKTFGGVKPYRTYVGYRYQGGFSDHLPVYVKLKYSYHSLATNEQ